MFPITPQPATICGFLVHQFTDKSFAKITNDLFVVRSSDHPPPPRPHEHFLSQVLILLDMPGFHEVILFQFFSALTGYSSIFFLFPNYPTP